MIKIYPRLRFSAFSILLSILSLHSIKMDAQCLDFVTAYGDFTLPPCGMDCDTTRVTFEVWQNEAYYFYGTAGSEYVFEFCDGYDPTGNWEAVLTVGEYDSDTELAVPGSDFASTTGCSITFTAPATDTFLIVLTGNGNCGGPYVQVDNGYPTLTCGPNGAICDVCEAGNITDITPVELCPNASTSITTDGMEDSPIGGGYGFYFSNALGGTGALVNSFILTNTSSPYTVDADLGGALSNIGLQPLEGLWAISIVSFSDANSASSSICAQSVDSLVINFISPTIQADLSDVSCTGDTNGSISINLPQATTPLVINWENGATTSTIDNLSPGDYPITVTDASSCTYTGVFSILEPTIIGTTIDSTNSQLNLNCNGASDGAVFLNTTGGTLPYSFIWSNGATTASITGLGADSYSGTITDANSCGTLSPLVSITEPDPIQTSVNIQDNNDGTGFIDLMVSGGFLPYTYLWSNGATTQDLDGLLEDNYTVTITDNNGCTEIRGPLFVEVGIDNIEGLSALELLPNPTSGLVNIHLELDRTMDVQLELVNIMGRQLVKIPVENLINKQFELDLSTYPDGIYFVRIFLNEQVISRRVSKF